MDEEQGDHGFDDVIALCAAIRQAEELLFLDDASAIQLRQHLGTVESLVATGWSDRARIIAALKPVRYVLVESADGPLSPFLIDSVATVIGDGHGKLFFKPSH